MISTTVGALTASLALLAPVAGPAIAFTGTDPALNSKNYSVTWAVHNASNQTLTVVDVRVDNGASIEGHQNSVAPRQDLTIKADNHGNGVQLWVEILPPNGTPIFLDADVPKTRSNWIAGHIGDNAHPESTAIYGFTSGHIGSGNNPTASVTIMNGRPGHCATSRSNPACTDDMGG